MPQIHVTTPRSHSEGPRAGSSRTSAGRGIQRNASSGSWLAGRASRAARGRQALSPAHDLPYPSGARMSAERLYSGASGRGHVEGLDRRGKRCTTTGRSYSPRSPSRRAAEVAPHGSPTPSRGGAPSRPGSAAAGRRLHVLELRGVALEDLEVLLRFSRAWATTWHTSPSARATASSRCAKTISGSTIQNSVR